MANFARNLEAIEAFPAGADASPAFDAPLEGLAGTVVPNLQRFPGMGHPFLERLVKQLKASDSHGELREYLMSSYLLLYSRVEGIVYLRSMRHHRQLWIDFEGLWPRDTRPRGRRKPAHRAAGNT